MRSFFLSLFVCFSALLFGQTPTNLAFNQEYRHLKVQDGAGMTYAFKLEKSVLYQFALMQLGIDVMLTLTDESGKTIVEQDAPNGKYGKELFEFTAPQNGAYQLTIKRFEEEGNTNSGLVSFYVKQFSAAEMRQRKQAEKALDLENAKNVLTADIDHFWEAFDQLKHCKSHYDSVTTIQNLYFDRGTVGLKDFIELRNWYADDFVKVVSDSAAFYRSVRENTLSVKQAEPLIQAVFDSLSGIYPNFKPFKVCFAIGKMSTGGTVSNRLVLIGTELTTTGDVAKIPQRIKGIVAHECVHTQQKESIDTNAIGCYQLYACLREGAANFIGELTTGTTNYSAVNQYGEAHENELWAAFKASLCRQDTRDWMYNGATAQGKPADLGYFVGYKICQAYYQKAKNKRQAIVEIIEMDDPISFLQKSGYDQVKKK